MLLQPSFLFNNTFGRCCYGLMRIIEKGRSIIIILLVSMFLLSISTVAFDLGHSHLSFAKRNKGDSTGDSGGSGEDKTTNNDKEINVQAKKDDQQQEQQQQQEQEQQQQ